MSSYGQFGLMGRYIYGAIPTLLWIFVPSGSVEASPQDSIPVMSSPAPATASSTSDPIVNEDKLDDDPIQELDWSVTGNLQVDVLPYANVPDDSRKNSELRRARLAGTVDWDFDWRLSASADLAKPGGLRDLFVEYRGWPIYLQAGRFAEPFGLLQGGSGSAVFMERPEALALVPGYGLGAAANVAGESIGFTIGVFSATQNDIYLGGRKEDAVTARLTFSPIRSDDWAVHLGVSASLRRSGEGFLQFVAIPETTLLLDLNAHSAIYFADSTSPGSNRYSLYGSEFAARYRSVLFQAEYVSARLNLVNIEDASGADVQNQISPVYSGFYAEAAWAITGEERDYSVRHGTFSGIYPLHPAFDAGLGAIEIAARFSKTDLRYAVVGGDTAQVVSTGMNWYPTDNFRITLEGLHTVLDTGDSRQIVNAVQMRFQVHFLEP